MSDQNMVERVARAIYDDCSGWFDEALEIGPDDLQDTARAVLAALSPSPLQTGE
jgi:hypothetical protein